MLLGGIIIKNLKRGKKISNLCQFLGAMPPFF